MTTTPVYEITITTVGNPDRGQYAPITARETLTAHTIKDLRAAVRMFQHFHDIGGGNWTIPPLLLNGNHIGFMSYNGAVWSEQGAGERLEIS